MVGSKEAKGKLQKATTDRVRSSVVPWIAPWMVEIRSPWDPLHERPGRPGVGHRVVGAIATRPWATQTVRWVLRPLMIPVGLFTVQLLTTRAVSLRTELPEQSEETHTREAWVPGFDPVRPADPGNA